MSLLLLILAALRHQIGELLLHRVVNSAYVFSLYANGQQLQSLRYNQPQVASFV